MKSGFRIETETETEKITENAEEAKR